MYYIILQCYITAFAVSATTVSRIISSLARVPSRREEETRPVIGVPRAGRSSLELASNPPGIFAATLERELIAPRLTVVIATCSAEPRWAPRIRGADTRSFTGPWHALFLHGPARDARRSEIRSLGPSVRSKGKKKKKKRRKKRPRRPSRCGFSLKTPANVRDRLSW